MTTYTPSDAAKAYARENGHEHDGNEIYDFVQWHQCESALAFDAGNAAALATVAPVRMAERVLTKAKELDGLSNGSVIRNASGLRIKVRGLWEATSSCAHSSPLEHPPVALVYDPTWAVAEQPVHNMWADNCKVPNAARPNGKARDPWALCAVCLPSAFPAPVPATTEPMLLTDPEDPRIKPGARVRWVTDYTLTSHLTADSGEIDAAAVHRWVVNIDPNETCYLLAEALDPDADVLTALDKAEKTFAWGVYDKRKLLTEIRTAGLDVVKRES